MNSVSRARGASETARSPSDEASDAPHAQPTTECDPMRGRVIKDEAECCVEILAGPAGEQVVRKIYRPAAGLRWRSLGMVSRAQREYLNLERVRDAGLPVVTPLGFRESRRFGCVLESTLDTGLVVGASLKQRLHADPRPPDVQRRVWMRELGALLRRMHAAGLLSLSFFPRNLLVCEPPGPTLVLCDQPGLVAFEGSLLTTARADLDLYDLVFTPGRRRELSSSDRFRILLAYTAGDRAHVRAIWNRLQHRRRWRHRSFKGAIAAASRLGILGRARGR